PGLGTDGGPYGPVRSGDDAGEGMTAQRGDGGAPRGAPELAELASWPVEELLEEIAVGGAAPACGSAAAVAAGLSAALTGKVARRSRDLLPDAEALARTADELRRRAGALAAADAAARHAMVTTRRLPDAARSVPEQIRDIAGELTPLAARLAAHGNPGLHADAVGAAQLAQAARAATEAILASNSG